MTAGHRVSRVASMPAPPEKRKQLRSDKMMISYSNRQDLVRDPSLPKVNHQSWQWIRVLA